MFTKLRFFLQAFKAVRSGDSDQIDAVTRAAMAGPKSSPCDAAQDTLFSPSSDLLYPLASQLTDDHIVMIRRMRLDWNGMESGAPQCVPSQSFTGGKAPDLIRTLIGDADDIAIAHFMVALRPALSIFMDKAELQPGTYPLSNMDADGLARTKRGLDNADTLFAITPDMTMTVTDADIALAKAAQWEWPDEDDMFSAFEAGDIAGPTVDPKRPYGDMTYIALDMHRVLGWPIEARTENGHIGISDEQEAEATRLHFRQLGTMQAFLEHATVTV
ncbi:hypothetical protein MWU61_09820 [Loktanella sp. F6476L]|uniref:hypothetical protein n=1 Tax=Loktanella sp. F6476L TaxID=2926405 RepID=UPI001FF46FE8|nr:hypothetical protein [Loktanella sp. F6476L]MCK0120838.1 hypothetical protein [Loktanella sp. F6476L]